MINMPFVLFANALLVYGRSDSFVLIGAVKLFPFHSKIKNFSFDVIIVGVIEGLFGPSGEDYE